MKISLFTPSRRRAAIALSLTAAALLAPASASALVTKTYTPNKCLGIDQATEDLLLSNNSANRDTTWLRNPNGVNQPITVVCPIIKQTSGPGIAVDDHIHSIDIPVALSGGTATCTMNLWRSDVLRDGSRGNLVFSQSVSRSTNGILRITPNFGFSEYWSNVGGSQATPNWMYIDIECDLPGLSHITTYTVNEFGTQQPTLIYPMSSCYPDRTNATGPWRYAQVDVITQEENGGRVYFQGGDDTETHVFRCPVPNNVSVEVSVLPPFLGSPGNPQVLGCNIDALPFNGVTWSAISQSSGTTAFQTLPRGTQPSILTPASGTHELVCGQKVPGNGDGSIISFRTNAPLSRNTTGSVWTATASHTSGGDVAGNAIDTNTGSRWASGKAQNDTSVSQYIQIDMKASKTIRQIVLNSGNSNDYPRNFKVYVRATDSGWSTATPVYTAFPSTSNVVSARFPPVTGRYVRVVLTPTTGVTRWWSIHDFNVYP